MKVLFFTAALALIASTEAASYSTQRAAIHARVVSALETVVSGIDEMQAALDASIAAQAAMNIAGNPTHQYDNAQGLADQAAISDANIAVHDQHMAGKNPSGVDPAQALQQLAQDQLAHNAANEPNTPLSGLHQNQDDANAKQKIMRDTYASEMEDYLKAQEDALAAASVALKDQVEADQATSSSAMLLKTQKKLEMVTLALRALRVATDNPNFA